MRDLSRRELLYGAGLLGAAGLLSRGPAAAAADPAPLLRLPALDYGPVLRHGGGPAGCDALGAREAIAFADPADPHRLLLHYDGAGPDGWLACRAESVDGGRTWSRQGPVLRLGPRGAPDGASASSPWVLRGTDGTWHMWYLGAQRATSAPRRIPEPPYSALHATAPGPRGPWRKSAGPPVIVRRPGSWYADSASPGPVTRFGGEWLMHFSGASAGGASIGLARSASLGGPWSVDARPLLPLGQRLENAAVHRDPTTGLWWLLANHIGTRRGSDGLVYTDAVWAYWSSDPTSFAPSRSAVVLDGLTCPWTTVVGMPSVLAVGDRLALFYDGIADRGRTDHMGRDVGMASLALPALQPL